MKPLVVGMEKEEMQKLKRCILKAYGWASCKCVTGLGTGDTFIIDNGGDFDGSSCTISVTVLGDELLNVCLQGDFLLNDEVKAWVRSSSQIELTRGEQDDLVFQVTPKSLSRLEELAYAMAYMEPSDEDSREPMCNERGLRLTKSLSRLHGVLGSHWDSDQSHSSSRE
jgi:hypothetical protein